MNYRCETDIAVVAEKQESADPNGRWEHFKSTIIKAEDKHLDTKPESMKTPGY